MQRADDKTNRGFSSSGKRQARRDIYFEGIQFVGRWCVKPRDFSSMKTSNIYPVILAAGPSIRRFFPSDGDGHAWIGIRSKSPQRIARGIAQLPCTLRSSCLGCDASRLARYVPANATVVINRNWRAGPIQFVACGIAARSARRRLHALPCGSSAT